jgi:MinD-like ATPase involved in chromosome partitioning or flagellar assembly
VVLLAEGLHRLTWSIVSDLGRSRMPFVLLTANPNEPRLRNAAGVILSPDDDPGKVHQAILAAIRGERTVVPAPTSSGPPEPESQAREVAAPPLAVVAVASGPGSPGRTTIALNLAAALGAVAPTILVDADLSGPSVAAHIDADPTRNIYMLAHAEPETADEWSHAIRQELQVLGGRNAQAAVLCGVPKLDLRVGITARFLERLIQELRDRYRYVVLDIGAELLSREAAPHRAALQAADLVLLVGSADTVGLWNARTGLALLEGSLGIDPDRVAVVVNRHSRRLHHSQAEIEWALGLAMAAVIPYDHMAVQGAVSVQRPLILGGRGPAAKSLLDLAERIYGGTVTLPPEQPRGRRLDFVRRWLPAMLTRQPRSGNLNTSGRLDDEHQSRGAARTAGTRPRSNR